MKLRIVKVFLMVLMLASASVAFAQNYPNKPIKMITQAPGSSSDFAARIIAQGITGPLGQPVVIDNRPSGVIPGQVTAQSAPDGYTILVIGGNVWTESLIHKIPYDPIKDLAPITLAAHQTLLFVIHPQLPVNSIKDLIALAKARPGELNYASAGAGSTPQLGMELFKSLAGVNITHVPYKANSNQMADLIGGQVQMSLSPAAAVMPQVKSNRLKVLAITSLQPSPLFPGIPTIAAVLPGYEVETLHTVFAPANTPAPIIARLNQEIVRYLNTADAKEKFLVGGVETLGTTPEELAAREKSEMTRLGKVIKDAGIRED